MDAKELSKQLNEAAGKITPEERKEAEKIMQKLEEQGFFLLCGWEAGEKNRGGNGQKDDELCRGQGAFRKQRRKWSLRRIDCLFLL